MTTLTGKVPDAVQRSRGSALFYFGAKPLELGQLPSGVEFTCVYSPSDSKGWRALRYRALEMGFQVKAERGLESSEVEYFEGLLRDAG